VILRGKQISKLNPFSVKMLTINRYFDISKAIEKLGYKPVVGSEEGWRITCERLNQEREKKKLAQFKRGEIAPVFDEKWWQITIYLGAMIFSYFWSEKKINIFSNPKEWKWEEIIFFAGFLMALETVLDFVLILHFKSTDKNNLIKPNQTHYELDLKSKIIIFFNRWQSVPYILTFYYYVWNCEQIQWKISTLGLSNTIPAFFSYFVLYDLMYYAFHRTLHHESIYRFIHKHHH
jgi:hypothetical protein